MGLHGDHPGPGLAVFAQHDSTRRRARVLIPVSRCLYLPERHVSTIGHAHGGGNGISGCARYAARSAASSTRYATGSRAARNDAVWVPSKSVRISGSRRDRAGGGSENHLCERLAVLDAKTAGNLYGSFSRNTGGSLKTFSRRCYMKSHPPPATSDGTCFWRLSRSIWPRGTIWLHRRGPSYESCSGLGSRRNWRSSEPMRWSGHRPHFASTVFTCPLGIWRLRGRTG